MTRWIDLLIRDILRKVVAAAMIAGAALAVAACDRDIEPGDAVTADIDMNAMDMNMGTDVENSMDYGNGLYPNEAGPSANKGSIGGPGGPSGVVEPSDPQIAQLCRSAELTGPACRSLDNQFQNLEAGVGALNAPAEMTLDASYTVALAIGRDEDEAEVKATAGAEAGPASSSEVGDVRLAQRMRVTLSGSAFRITPEGDAERELGLSRQATWRWQVTPTGEGPQSLVATVEPIAVLPDGRRLELRPARRRLDVQVSVTTEEAMGRVERFLKSTTGILVALAALIAAISLVAWRLRNFGRHPE